jgi:hypothetical protein
MVDVPLFQDQRSTYAHVGTNKDGQGRKIERLEITLG